MRIGINAVGFNPGVMGGLETYFRELLHHLQLESGGHDYLIACKNTEIDSFELQNQRFSLKVIKVGRPSLRWLIRGVLFELIHIDIIKPCMDSLQVDVIHHPFTVLEPLGLKIPSVLTFADMQHEFYPDFFTKKELRYRDYSYKASTHEARRIIVYANFTKECLIEKYAISPDKIDVIAPGYNEAYCHVTDRAVLDEVKVRYGLPNVFIYYPAALWPHKNHRTLLDALCLIRDRYGIEVKLVLSGLSKGRAGELRTEIFKRNLQKVVTVLGYIPYDDLPSIYNLATMMVFPSLFEGFGIPLVEAMACGCPVVCSNNTSMPEIVGGAALMFDPVSVSEMASSIIKVLDDRELCHKMSMAGLEQAKLFNWCEAVRQTQAVYEKACS